MSGNLTEGDGFRPLDLNIFNPSELARLQQIKNNLGPRRLYEKLEADENPATKLFFDSRTEKLLKSYRYKILYLSGASIQNLVNKKNIDIRIPERWLQNDLYCGHSVLSRQVAISQDDPFVPNSIDKNFKQQQEGLRSANDQRIEDLDAYRFNPNLRDSLEIIIESIKEGLEFQWDKIIRTTTRVSSDFQFGYVLGITRIQKTQEKTIIDVLNIYDSTREGVGILNVVQPRSASVWVD